MVREEAALGRRGWEAAKNTNRGIVTAALPRPHQRRAQRPIATPGLTGRQRWLYLQGGRPGRPPGLLFVLNS